MQEKSVHEAFMWRCLQLAKLGVGYVAPNPMVGAVLVYDTQIIGEGYHRYFGGKHAEANCIDEAMNAHPEKIADSVLYVSLEPCAHHGKTPPCADLIIHHKIKKVVIACRDSFSEVNGKGIEKLQQAGVEVVYGVLEKEAIALNKAFFCFYDQKRPYITLKWAQTADGYMAGSGSDRLMISNEYTNTKVHQWRSENAAIMIGAHTAIKDNPRLDNRKWFGAAPQKLLFDPRLKAPSDLHIFNPGAGTLWVLNNSKDAVAGNIIYLKADNNAGLAESLQQLFQLNIQSLLVEGGQKLLQLFINQGLWDEARVITNQELFTGSGLPAPQLTQAEKLGATALANDEIVFFKNKVNTYIYANAGLL